MFSKVDSGGDDISSEVRERAPLKIVGTAIFPTFLTYIMLIFVGLEVAKDFSQDARSTRNGFANFFKGFYSDVTTEPPQ